MNLMLSNYGHRYLRERLQYPTAAPGLDEATDRLLIALHSGKPMDRPALDQRVAQGMLQPARPSLTTQDIARRYRQNPLENLTRLSFELTTARNFHCRHCRNGPAARLAPAPIDLEPLKAVVDDAYPIGIRHFDFIGGEISKFGIGWLELAAYIRRKPGTTVVLFTNGWWLEQTDFTAAGVRYADESAYLADLQQHGVKHLVFSIDGTAERHDHWRRHRGLYRRILDAFPRLRAASLVPRVSMVIRRDDPALPTTLREMADALYTFPAAMSEDDRIRHLIDDPTNAFSNFIDIGHGAALSDRSQAIDAFPAAVLRCKAAYRPAPKLILTAQGEVAVCPLFAVGTGYGNIHQRRFREILNHFQEAFVYQLHASGDIQHYRRLVDHAVFGDAVEHLCTLRVILTLLAKGLNDDPTAFSDPQALRRLNENMAVLTGHRTA
jgi:MoaA/NifB/PqqE/SkfB family radical SAM enzyme